MNRHTTDKHGRQIDLVPVLAKLDAFFRANAARTASVEDVTNAVRERDYAAPIPRCGALLREALGQGLIKREQLDAPAPVEEDAV